MAEIHVCCKHKNVGYFKEINYQSGVRYQTRVPEAAKHEYSYISHIYRIHTKLLTRCKSYLRYRETVTTECMAKGNYNIATVW